MNTLALIALTQGPPGTKPVPPKPPGPEYFELLERNTHIIYPVLAIVVLGLLVAGILASWRAHDMDGVMKAKLKREILLELRVNRGGVSAEALARKVGVQSLRLVRLLEEMQRDGHIEGHTNTQRLTVWQIKSASNAMS